jgi:alkanesulfonate monooxygenase SsuD/methylene tetrahydromethanopterin reductase-like flavin-dependent oxidoreductase (luciferase family)
MQLPLRQPAELAQRLMTMHVLTGGRFRVGLGAGSTPADYDTVGVDYDRRFNLFGEGLSVVRRLLAGERVGAADLHPWPNALGGPPIYIGAWESGLWIKRAARDYDGWMASGRGTSMNGPGGRHQAVQGRWRQASAGDDGDRRPAGTEPHAESGGAVQPRLRT